MKVAIIEDEKPAAEKLERYLRKYDEEVEILAHLTSVSDSVSWLSNHQQKLDLIFMDIQLTDGLSFEVFQTLRISKPVIFTTAYDEYAIDAFKVNSIDYLLKPITFTALSQAMKKLDSLREQFSAGSSVSTVIQDLATQSYKSRFLVRLGNHIHSLKTEEVALFYAEGRTVFLITHENKKFILEYKLQDLEELLDPALFFRVNRTFIININSIADVLVYSNSRLSVSLSVRQEKDIIVSREKVGVFKEWLAGGTSR